jgi:tetratricopeptide (TPR) repeat protein
MSDASLASLRARLQRFNSDGDMTRLLDDAIPREIACLSLDAGVRLDMAAVEIVAWLKWYRSQGLNGDAALAERETAINLFELIYIGDPQAVPGALQSLLATRRSAKQEKFFSSTPFSRPSLNVQETMRRSTELFQRYHLTNDAASLDDSIRGFRELREALPVGNMLRPLVEVMLGMALQFLWQRTNSVDVIDEAIRLLRSGLAGLPETHEQRAMAMAALAVLLMAKYTEHEDIGLLTEAKDLMERAVEVAPPGSPVEQQVKAAWESLRLIYPTAVGQEGKIAEQIVIARRRLEQTQPGHPDRPHLVLALGAALAVTSTITGIGDTLAESESLLREAVAATSDDSPIKPPLLGMLGGVLAERSALSRDPELAANAVTLIRRGLAALPASPRNPFAGIFRGHLASAIWQQYASTQALGLLPEAIKEGRLALEQVASDSPGRPGLMLNLSIALHDWHHKSGDVAALEEAIDLGRRAERTTAANALAHRQAMNSLSISLTLMFEHTGDAEFGREAISWARRALVAVPENHPDTLVHVVTLAQALENFDDGLQEAIDLLRGAAHSVGLRERRPGDLQYAANAMASALLRRAAEASDLAALDEAIGWLRRATAPGVPPSPGRDNCAGRLGQALRMRYDLTRDRGALAEALSVFAEAVNADISPRLRVTRNAELARTAATLWDWPRALEAYSAAIGQLPVLAGPRLYRADQEYQLSVLSGLACDAAACALAAGEPGRAVGLLEQGRGVLLRQALDRRGVAHDLAGDHPELAARLAAVADQLEALGRAQAGQADAREYPAELGRQAALRRSLAAEWDDLVEQVQQTSSASLLQPGSDASLADLAESGPIVWLNVSGIRSDAIVLTETGLELVPLSKTARLGASNLPDQIAERRREFQRSLAVLADPAGDAGTRAGARGYFTQTLGWLWDTFVEPVLDRLGLLEVGPPPAGRRPRLWWCPTGQLAMLPIHAAGRDGAFAGDKVISSYTPTARALQQARRRVGRLDPAAGMLVVAMSATPGQPDLPRAKDEASWLHQKFRARRFSNEQATADRVLAALPLYPMAHLACHGIADPDNPSASRLVCYDRQEDGLTLTQIQRLDLPDAELAYLSACATSSTAAKLADEALHITGAFQLAGYREVVGTLWEVGDATSYQLTQAFYTALSEQDPADRSAARALHEAISVLRDAGADEVDWAPYVHVGA